MNGHVDVDFYCLRKLILMFCFMSKIFEQSFLLGFAEPSEECEYRILLKY